MALDGAQALLSITINTAVCMFQGHPPLDTHLQEDHGAAMRLGPCPATQHGTGMLDIGMLMPATLLLLLFLSPTGKRLHAAVG